MRKFPVATQKNWDNLLLLCTYKPFNDRVREIRKRLNIADDGLRTDEEISAWHTQTDQRCDEIMDSTDFQRQLRSIRTNFVKKKISRPEAEKMSEELHLLLPSNYLTHSVKELTKEFNVPENYQMAIRGYIIRNAISFMPANNFTIGPWDPKDNKRQARYVPLRIYAKLTDEDLREIKEEVNRCFGKNLPSFKNIRSLERNINIEAIDTNGELDAVTYKHEKVDRSTIAERFLGSRKKKAEIKKIKEALNKTRKNRFGKK